MEDLDQQSQEIEVLQSIFGESLVFFDNVENGVENSSLFRYYKLKVSINLPDQFKLLVKKEVDNQEEANTLDTTTTTSTTTTTTTTNNTTTTTEIAEITENSNEYNSYQIVSLPSITFKFDFPIDYPSKSKPNFKISCCWLTLKQMEAIIDYLDSQWEPDELVIFKYLDWIKNTSASFLGLTESLYLSSDNIELSDDNDSFFNELDQLNDNYTLKREFYWKHERFRWEHNYDWNSLVSALPIILAHNSHEAKVQFTLNSHECPVCYCDYSASECTLLPCLHFLCNLCLSKLVDVNITEGKVKSIKCSDPYCNQVIDQSIVQKTTSPKNFERYLYLLKQLDPFQTKCNRCDGWATIDNFSRSTFCRSCYFTMCMLCTKKFHPGLTCQGVPTRGSTRTPAPRNGSNTLRFCPKCSVGIVKTEGCNKCICPSCGVTFCWVCIKAISGYEHFSATRCQLFEIPEELEQELQMRKQRNVTYYTHSVTGETTCLKCRSKVYQYDKNNYAHCYTCYKHICFQCKAFITGTKHFMTSACDNHSK